MYVQHSYSMERLSILNPTQWEYIKIEHCLEPIYQHHGIQINKNEVLIVGGSGSSKSHILALNTLEFARKADIKNASHFNFSSAPVCYVYCEDIYKNIHIYSIKEETWEMIPSPYNN